MIDAAATWGRVAEREMYSEFGLSNGNRSYFGSGPGIIEKSALFQRLLSGKAPLAYRPPTSYSYPWYEVIEGTQSKHRVMIDSALSLGSMLNPGAGAGENCISINGAFWLVEQTITPDLEYIVSWGKYPMRWRLKMEREKSGSIGEKLKARENYILEQGAAIMRPEQLRQSIKIELESLEIILRNPNHPNIEVDENDDCWERQWALERIGLSGWPYAGEVLAVEQKPLKTITVDNFGNAVLFRVDPDDQSSDPAGEAWIRAEHDAETNASRYVSMFVSAQSKLEQRIQDECEKFLESLLDLAMSREGSIFVMDRSESNKEILRLFRTRARPTFTFSHDSAEG